MRIFMLRSAWLYKNSVKYAKYGVYIQQQSYSPCGYVAPKNKIYIEELKVIICWYIKLICAGGIVVRLVLYHGLESWVITLQIFVVWLYFIGFLVYSL